MAKYLNRHSEQPRSKQSTHARPTGRLSFIRVEGKYFLTYGKVELSINLCCDQSKKTSSMMSRRWLLLLSLLFGSANGFSSGTPFVANRGVSTMSTTITLRAGGDKEQVPLIPRETLFGNPEFASPTLSPDGKFLAYLAPSPPMEDGKGEVLNVFVRDTYDASTSRMVTQDQSRGIRSFSWAQDSSTIIYLQDFEGDENFHVWAVDVTTPNSAARDLTPGESVKASSIMTNKRYPDHILVGTNQRTSKTFDMYKCELASGELTLDTENPGDVIGWGSEDESFQVRVATVRNQIDSSTTIRVRDDSSSEWRDLLTFPYGEEGGFVDFCGPDEPDTGYITSTLGRDTKALLKINLKTGETLEEISSNDKCDVAAVMLDEDTKAVRLVSYNYARKERVFFDRELEEHFKALDKLRPKESEASIVSRTKDETLWVIVYSRSDGPSEYCLYDTKSKTTEPLFVSKPDLLEYALAPMEDVRIIARDGLELVGYLTRTTLPPEGKPPLILLVHGGPWARDYWGFNSQAQWFANRGYSTLQVNFRASTGYGKSFLHKGDGEWGVGTMQHDLTDAVQWAIDEGIADPEKVCIYGGSYGGYACLAGLTFTPDLYCCGVDVVGPSNVKTLLDSIPDYWAPLVSLNPPIPRFCNIF